MPPYNYNYGVPRIQFALSQRGFKAGIHLITRIMRENRWASEA
ncbi:IS3 family transposase [Lachnoanaerobaculum sp. Marseille-Q4761]